MNTLKYMYLSNAVAGCCVSGVCVCFDASPFHSISFLLPDNNFPSSITVCFAFYCNRNDIRREERKKEKKTKLYINMEEKK